jgi:hypothetical protein
MITRKELQDYARLKKLALGNVEKDYLIDIALFSISKNTKRELVFKGGTCLFKFHRLNRFSEDLDFSAVSELDVNAILKKVLSDFEKFGAKAALHKKKEPHNSILATLRIEGPLFSGKPQTYAHLGIDINLGSGLILDPELLSHRPLYRDIPEIPVLCMKQEEILAEKIRALATRKRARDLFDVHFLLNNGVVANTSLIRKKMEYYGEEFELKKINLNDFENRWEKELKGLTPSLPDFSEVKKYVYERLKVLHWTSV